MNKLLKPYTAFKILIVFFLFQIMSCKKQDDWLNVRRQKSDVEPTSLKDFQAILDNDITMNGESPTLGLLGIDNYYVSPDIWMAVSPTEKNAYIWAVDIFDGQPNQDWDDIYKIVEYSNIVIDGLNKLSIPKDNLLEWNNAMGSAHFYRAKAFLDAVSLYAKPYSDSTSTDLGIPVRLSSDVNEQSTRALLINTYRQIIFDLKQSDSLLPMAPAFQMRPSKPSAEALLARVYLNMSDYVNARIYSDISLQNHSTLLDFNTLDTTASYPFPLYPHNPEVAFWSVGADYNLTTLDAYAIVDSNLYNLYDDNDLRKKLYYLDDGTGLKKFVGTFTGSAGTFAGMATDEVYLINAECHARLGAIDSALSDLNILLSKRYKTNLFTPITGLNQDEAIAKILMERRKEMPFTENIRWDDLRRLNRDPKYAITLYRNMNGVTYSILPNDLRYVYPIPPDEIKMTGMQQNTR